MVHGSKKQNNFKMINTATDVIAPAESQQVVPGTDDLTGSTEKGPDHKYASNVELSPIVDNNSSEKPLWRTLLIIVALLTSVFFVALDVNILVI
ncbi:hypothetical protein Daus18300_009617 [Diaporthe australafricana]|uniref:Uncharacterized protein n=1 Tax=Diaporthe australafricana TaxID=127596 RepID=A0ABR3WDM1_9PEZI